MSSSPPMTSTTGWSFTEGRRRCFESHLWWRRRGWRPRWRRCRASSLARCSPSQLALLDREADPRDVGHGGPAHRCGAGHLRPCPRARREGGPFCRTGVPASGGRAARRDRPGLLACRARYAPLHEDNCIDPLGQGSTVCDAGSRPEQSLRHAMHVDVSVAQDHAEARVRAAFSAGGRIVDDSEAPGASILADRSGNKVCIAAAQTARRRPSRMVHERPDPGLRGLERHDPTGPVGPLASDWHEATPPVRSAALRQALSESWRSAATARQALRGQDTLHTMRVPIRTQSVIGAGSPCGGRFALVAVGRAALTRDCYPAMRPFRPERSDVRTFGPPRMNFSCCIRSRLSRERRS